MKLNKIHTDKRGDIYLLTEDLESLQEVTIFKTKKGYARGGCIHKINDEFAVVLEGVIKYIVGDKIIIMVSGELTLIPKNIPHYFVSLQNSIVLEWGATPEEKKEKYPKFRKVVNKINENNTAD